MFESIKRFFHERAEAMRLSNEAVKAYDEFYSYDSIYKAVQLENLKKENDQLIKEKGELLLMLKNLGINAVKKEDNE